MDNVTHGLHGLALYAVAVAMDPALANNPVALGAVFWASAIGSQAPDFDFVVRVFKNDVAYLKHHRGITHSIPAWFIWPTVLAAVLSFWFPGHYGLLWLWAFLGVLTHVGMDLLTTYGTTAFWPLSKKRLGYDVLMIVDLGLWAFGAWGIYLWLTGRPPEEVLLWALLPSLLYIGLRGLIQFVLRLKVRAAYPQAFAEGRVERVSIIPLLGLLRWNLVVELQDRFDVGRAHLLKGLTIERTLHKPFAPAIAHPYHEQAQQSELYQVFHWFARHLLIEEERDEDGTVRLNMTDLAFRFGDRFAFRAHVKLHPDGQVLDARLNDTRAATKKRAQAKTHDAR